ncbi:MULTISPECIES: recombination mediator RecR [unclassified Acinetobacter]|uniref:recombination mediator RecR n=1 Tax=unclassified Acinetobacter TaxID=196816 RepID=UPI0035BACE65
MYSERLNHLIQKLRILPSVGSKSAQRMALHLLMRKRQEALELAQAIQAAVDSIHECEICHALTEQDICEICQDDERDASLICVVESPADIFPIEQSGSYRGKYHVLNGHLSPLDGIGPEEVGIPHLVARLSHGDIQEVILATNATVEGQATAHYLVEACRHLPIKISRIAQGVPLGGELEYVDSHTLHQALTHRLRLNQS